MLRLALLAALAALATATLIPRPEMTGADYGDMLDAIRTRLDVTSHERDPESAGNLGQIRNMLQEIKRGLVREQQASDRLFGGIDGEYAERVSKLSAKINGTRAWLSDVRQFTHTSAESIVNLTADINAAPGRQQRRQARMDEAKERVEVLRAERRKARERFQRRSAETKDTLAALNAVMNVLGRNNGDVNFFNTTLKAALNRHNSPKLQAMLRNLGSANVFASKDDLDDLRAMLERLKQQLHEFLISITRTQIAYARLSKERLARRVAERDLEVQRFKALVVSVPAAHSEVKRLVEETARKHRLYPNKVAQLHRAKKALRRLRWSHLPLIQQYQADLTRRAQQVASVRQLLAIVRERYDMRPGLRKPHTAK